MKKHILTALSLTALLPLCAQDIESLFYNVPEGLIVQIEPNRRRDMIDMIKAGRTATFPNKLGGVSTMTQFNNTYIKIEVSQSSTIDFKLLPVTVSKDSIGYIIGVSRTVCAPACDSDIYFYSTDWKRLNTEKYFTEPRIDNYFVNSSAVNISNISQYNEAKKSIPMEMISYSFSPDNNNLTSAMEYKSFTPNEISSIIEPYVETTTIVYTWSNGKYLIP